MKPDERRILAALIGGTVGFMAMRGKVIGAAIGAIVAVLIDASRQSRTRAAPAGAGSTRSTAPADSRTDYDVLGVRHDADLDEVRSRFRDLAKKYHPDHFQSASPQFREAAESEFKRIREAYERVLTRHGARP
ncbi:MAG: DnaJ domain-containing protein [Planctomycetes bacterium]|nr:DnaJ domain-containing protein [Planctomycetota bacterium]MCC7171822.1 DnaJ domain-containing protein [Planctomycetota bacterium]